MLNRKTKESIVSYLKDKMEQSRAIFLTNVVGMKSNDINALRHQVRTSKGAIVVTRNTLIELAAKGTKYEQSLKNLKGPNAIAFAFEDAPGVAKALYESSKENEVVQFKIGFLQDKELSAAQIVELAKLPSRDQMLATLLATFNAPVSAFARVLYAINEKKQAEEVKA